MFNLIWITLFALLGIMTISNNETFHIIGVICLSFSACGCIISLIYSLNEYSGQIERFENLRGDIKKINIFEQRNKLLIEQFKLFFSKEYPEFEKEIFSKINDSIKNSSEIIRLISIKYPNIKTFKALSSLVKEIRNLSEDFYELKLEIEEECVKIRYYNSDKWVLIKPKIPGDVNTVINS
jgi:hypothetical protein